MKNSIGFVFQNEDLLLLKNNSLPTEKDLKSLSSHYLRRFDLEFYDGWHYFCAELSEEALVPEIFQRLSLRNALSFLNPTAYRLAVKACSIIRWDKYQQFCSRCGNPTLPKTEGLERCCPVCHLSAFPRISPSIIVLIKKQNYLLMARNRDFLPGIYGLIAGFVEIGESTEEAVHREVKEEVGLKIKNLEYFGSQPWPFPDSLMIAFMADYCSGEIVVNPDEIAEADWYRYDNLPNRPTSISIASKLIISFINSQIENQK